MVRPEIGSELSRALAESRRAEARRSGPRRSRHQAGARGAVRLALGIRLVSMGHRLLRDAVEVV